VRRAIDGRRERFSRFVTGTSGLFSYDQQTYLQPLLQRQDRMSMAVGLEARVPFLDHPLVEWANSLTPAVKLGNGRPKRLLRLIAEGTLPHEIIYRSKVGFALPLAGWLLGPLNERVTALRDRGTLAAQVLPGRFVERLVSQFEQGDPAGATALWTLVALEAWRERFFGPGFRAPVAPIGASA